MRKKHKLHTANTLQQLIDGKIKNKDIHLHSSLRRFKYIKPNIMVGILVISMSI